MKGQETDKMILELFMNLKISLTGCKAQTKNECVQLSLSLLPYLPITQNFLSGRNKTISREYDQNHSGKDKS